MYRRLSRLDTVLDDMSRRAAQFHLTLGEIVRSTDTSPEVFLRYKNTLLTHMTDFMAELDRYLPRLAAAVAEAAEAGATGTGTGRAEAMFTLAAQADERPFLSHDELVDDWRRRWAALSAWFASDGIQTPAQPAASHARPGCEPRPEPRYLASSRCSARSRKPNAAG